MVGAMKSCVYIWFQSIKYITLKLMSKSKKSKKTKAKNIQQVFEQKQFDKSNTLIFGGILLAISSIALLIFVLSDKVFHLS